MLSCHPWVGGHGRMYDRTCFYTLESCRHWDKSVARWAEAKQFDWHGFVWLCWLWLSFGMMEMYASNLGRTNFIWKRCTLCMVELWTGWRLSPVRLNFMIFVFFNAGHLICEHLFKPVTRGPCRLAWGDWINGSDVTVWQTAWKKCNQYHAC